MVYEKCKNCTKIGIQYQVEIKSSSLILIVQLSGSSFRPPNLFFHVEVAIWNKCGHNQPPSTIRVKLLCFYAGCCTPFLNLLSAQRRPELWDGLQFKQRLVYYLVLVRFWWVSLQERWPLDHHWQRGVVGTNKGEIFFQWSCKGHCFIWAMWSSWK